MSRRPSYPTTKGEYQNVQGVWTSSIYHRPSVGQSLGLSTIEGSPSISPSDEAVSLLNFNEEDKDDVIRGRLRDLADFRLSTKRRTYERILTGVLAVILLWSLLRSNTSGRLLEKAKISIKYTKPPMTSSIPLRTFRSNLKPGYGYVTSFPYGGLTNQLVELFKLVHLGQRLDRTAILSDLKAVHSEGRDLPLSTFFDLKSFSYYTNVSMVEWQNVKLAGIQSPKQEKLSCWGWRDERPLARYSIHTDFWPPPGQLTVPSSIETSMTFPAIEVLQSQSNDKWLTEIAVKYFSSVENAPAFPDPQVLCFDNLFYVPSTHFVAGAVDHTFSIEEFAPTDPVWAKVGTHLRFNPTLDSIADELLHSLLGSRYRKPFVSVHIRQGDFVRLGRTPHSVVESYSSAVALVQADLAKRRGLSGWVPSWGGGTGGLPVLFATDSDDVSFIKKLTELGWIFINHNDFATATRFSGWHAGVLDSLILSRSVGFVGTKMSTFSYVAARRVEAWKGGVTRIVG